MAGTVHKKRPRDDASKSRAAPPPKKQKKQQQQQQQAPSSSDESDGEQEFQAVNLLDSDDDDIHNALADDGGESGSESSGSGGSTSGSEDERPRPTRTRPARPQPIARDAPANSLAKDAPVPTPRPARDDQRDQSGGDSSSEGDNDEFSDLGSDDDDDDDDSGDDRSQGDGNSRRAPPRSKRSDPEAFATSMSKILGTKVSSKNRADPVLARSADARERVRQVVDEELDRRARRKLREQKRRAMEKGRVRDVLVATTTATANGPGGGAAAGGESETTTAGILATERRLRKVAQRGVVQLFNAFRTAQVKAAEAERVARKQGVIGMDRKKDKVTEMSKKGFLDLIASGGGGLKKGPIEEA